MRDYEGEWHPSDVPGDTMVCRFYTKAVVDPEATAMARKSDPNAFPVYAEKPFVRLQSAGDAKTVWEKPVSHEHRAQFGRAWAAFERGAIDEIVGTPLSEWARIPRSLVIGLGQQGILSVEDVASVTDQNLAILGADGAQLRQAALDFLKPPDKAVVAMQQENKALREQLEQLQAQVDTMLAMPAVDQGDDAPKRRGRPPKQQEVS